MRKFSPTVISSFVCSACLVWIVSTAMPLVAQTVIDTRPLQHEDYDHWKTIESETISRQGDWVGYVAKPGEGDAILHIRHNRSEREYQITRGEKLRFGFEGKFAFYVITPDPEQIKKLKQENQPAEDMPQPRLEILELESGNRQTIERVSQYVVPAKGSDWVAFKLIKSKTTDALKSESATAGEIYQVTPEGIQRVAKSAASQPAASQAVASKGPESSSAKQPPQAKQPPSAEPKSQPAKQKSKSSDDKQKKKKEKQQGDTLVVQQLSTGRQFRFPWVVDFRFDETGTLIAFATSGPEPADDGVSLLDLKSGLSRTLLAGRGEYGTPVPDQAGRQLAFLTNRDTYEDKHPAWAVYHWNGKQKQARKIIDSATPGMPAGWWLARSATPVFREDGKLLFVQTQPVPEDLESEDPESGEESNQEKDEPDEKAKLDLWHWQDPFLQPEQLLRAESERNRSYLAVYDLNRNRLAQVATKQIPSVVVDPKSTATVVVGGSPDAYNKIRSWDYPGFADFHWVDLLTGKSHRFLEKSRGNPTLSPGGKFVTWWDGEKRTWYSLPVPRQPGAAPATPVDLGQQIPTPLFDELHDAPALPGPYGSAGWLHHDAGFLIYDRWDIWQVDPTGKTRPVNLTRGYGREHQIRLRRIQLDREARAIDPAKPMILGGLDHRTKASGFLRWDPDAEAPPRKLIWLNEQLEGLRKAEGSADVLFTRASFRRFPDLWSSHLGQPWSGDASPQTDAGFQSIRRLSNVNPQQEEYTWGTAELVRWKATDGQSLDGILYKPDGFDPEKKYPLIVYFYERYSDRLHQHYPPAAGRSIINFSFYVSRGYLIFVPDIPYRVGEPGPSAANAILPGVEHLIAQGYVDRERIGMQGHSWGGYQVAYLVTQTNLFACAESGAPVSNMTSAYGGIRWGSGMSRMFQYEKTQSRIGQTLWEAPDKYIANSPLFEADKINTPLLILHNDKDTAVPWYQGIELFVALRRLEKPAWMLNYNDDPHWVMGKANRLDFAKRMQQFFDHYLQGAPQPEWMASGIPAVDKGKKFGLEAAPEKNE